MGRLSRHDARDQHSHVSINAPVMGATMSDVSSVCKLLAAIHAPGDEGDVCNPDHARSRHVSIHARVTGAILPDYPIELD